MNNYINTNNTSTEIPTPGGQAKNLTFEEYLRGVFEINNGIENDPDNLVKIHAPELLKLARKQEQPKTSNNLVDADAVREDFIREVYRVLDADPTNDRTNAIIDAFDSLPTVSQEQPEVDLEAEIKKYCRDYYNCNYPDQIQNRNCSPVMTHIVEAAHHFWKKGYNAKKEK